MWRIHDVTHVAYDSQLRQCVENCEPHANVLGSLGDGSSGFANKLLSVETDLNPIVEEGEERGEGEGCYEDGDEAELEYWKLGYKLEDWKYVGCKLEY